MKVFGNRVIYLYFCLGLNILYIVWSKMPLDSIFVAVFSAIQV